MEEAAVLMQQGRTWEYESDFDQNGVLNWLGTNGRTTGYTNPCSSGKVIVTPSSVEGGSTPQGFIEHTSTGSKSYTTNRAGSSVVVQLPVPVVVNRYTLRHGLNATNQILRSWNLEGSMDGTEWVVLRRHENDTSLNGALATASWDANPDGLAFSHFRIIMTGANFSANHYLMMSGLELYGRIGGFAPGTVRFYT